MLYYRPQFLRREGSLCSLIKISGRADKFFLPFFFFSFFLTAILDGKRVHFHVVRAPFLFKASKRTHFLMGERGGVRIFFSFLDTRTVLIHPGHFPMVVVSFFFLILLSFSRYIFFIRQGKKCELLISLP